MRKKIFLISAVMLLSVFSAPARDTTGYRYLTDRTLMEWENPWLGGRSAAGMIFTERGLSDISLKGSHEQGDFRNVYDPASRQTYGLSTNSVMKTGKVVVSGTFAYDYSAHSEQRWLGLLTRTVILLCWQTVCRGITRWNITECLQVLPCPQGKTGRGGFVPITVLIAVQNTEI